MSVTLIPQPQRSNVRTLNPAWLSSQSKADLDAVLARIDAAIERRNQMISDAMLTIGQQILNQTTKENQ